MTLITGFLCLLEGEGHEVSVAYNGTECIAVAKDFRPEILLCDIGFPGMDAIRRPGLFGMMSFRNRLCTSPRPGEGTKTGFQLHIAKPVDLGKLRKALAEVS